jgi:tetratricopeptide (TPR) repeat protein
MKKTLVCGLVILCAVAGFGQALSRVFGKVATIKGEGIPDVKITVTMKEQGNWKREITTDAKGNFEIAFTDGTKIYVFQLVKEGYLQLNEDKVPVVSDEVKPKIFTSIAHDFAMATVKEMEGKLRELEAKKNPYIKYYEDGKAALLAGNKAEARKQFEACLKEKPDYIKVQVILASLDEEDGKHDAAIEKAEKAVKADDKEDLPAALKVLIRAYTAKKDKAKVAEYQKMLDSAEPDSPESLYNKAVTLLNKKDDAGAKPFLEKAVEMKSDFADALYELGFIYLREGNNAKCKEMMERFLKLVPTGEKAETAKETMKWL